MILLIFLAQTMRIAIPYLFAASGGVVAERAGVVSLTLEGFMLSGAFCAALGSHYSGSAVGGPALRRRRRAGDGAAARGRLHPLQGRPDRGRHRDQPAGRRG